ncbi:hypothetical protein BO94DRAFT_588840 [Aspergillus sclerotioniger CBS 115572]|uniref:Uncharacterized protein n=1 Tax=Aspergillus sclerotioniger CBS 115572 TaxID=1450535 RepID=A0A317VQZ4_9EURO|nr:hypothetical protein BO94DRAFT_588840 [Aspergillus sclerotioniger CBS 115572]PWY75979.1 hypothetical protein BO94DRAFT_588840 [Aspergillus sclerotioniger CBS 115572]
MEPKAPPHYPCNPNFPFLNTLLLPHLHWANAVPDAHASANLTINGTAFHLPAGSTGYHDKNWGDASVITSPKYWDWGHATLGPLSLHAYAYLAKDGQILLTSCAESAVEVRQVGANATYPPTTGIAAADGLTVRYNLGGRAVFVANLTKEVVVVHDMGVYARALGRVVGEIEGIEGEVYEGRGAYEEFVYGILYGSA